MLVKNMIPAATVDEIVVEVVLYRMTNWRPAAEAAEEEDRVSDKSENKINHKTERH
jgi:hypothetical protein